MSRPKGSKNKIKSEKPVVEDSLFPVEKKRGRPKGTKNKTNHNILNAMREQNEFKIQPTKINKDLREREKVVDNTMMDSTDVFIDEDDYSISLDGKKANSILCRYPALQCKNCDILKECKKDNKMVIK